MPRSRRIEFSGAIYHVTARGVNRRALFSDERDRQRFLQLFARETERQLWRCHAFCLMTNHYHILLETRGANLSRGMQQLNGEYGRWFNHQHERVGHLFQGRYHAVLVRSDAHLLELCRYIVLNPVRASMVASADAWPWSSYRSTAGLSQKPTWLDTEWVPLLFGGAGDPAREAYRRFVHQGAEPRGWCASNSPTTIPTSVGEVLAAVAAEFGVPVSRVLYPPRREAFRAAVYLLHRAASMSRKEIAALAGVSRARISQVESRLARGPADTELQRLLRDFDLVKHGV